MTKQTQYVVKGSWPFPPAMLDYNRANGATEADRELIAVYSADTLPDNSYPDEVSITMVGLDRPSVERWESFGWEVKYDDPHQFSAGPDAGKMALLTEKALSKLTKEEVDALRWHFGQHSH